MSYRKYMLFRVLIILVMAALAAWAASSDNLLLLIPAVIVLFAVLFTLRRRVKDVVVDERINTIAYRASRVSLVSFVILAVIAGAVLIYLAEGMSDVLFSIGLTLDYAACALMVFYWLAYVYYNRKYGGKE